MKIGTTLKITVAAIGIVGLLCIGIGVHQIILPKFGASTDTRSSVQTTAPSGLAETDVNQEKENRENQNQPQISAKEMEQINNFFAQLDAADAQVEADTLQSVTESETEYAPTDTDASAESTDQLTTQSAEDVMNTYLEAFKTRDFEVMGVLMTGAAKERLQFQEGNTPPFIHLESKEEQTEGLLTEEMAEIIEEMNMELMQQLEQKLSEALLKMYSQVEVVSPEYVGDEFHFRLRMPVQSIHEAESDTMVGPLVKSVFPEDLESVVKMRKENGAWRIYER